MRFHLLGLAHLPTRYVFQSCAFTQKIVKLARMLAALKHDVTFYGAAGSEVQATKTVEVVSADTLRSTYGDYDWTKEQFRYNEADAAHAEFNRRAIEEINERKQPGDYLLCPNGTMHQAISVGADLPTVESGIGYSGIFARFKVFESYAWMHFLYGKLRNSPGDGDWYDAVIPNYFDPADFTYQPKKQDYFLFLGRVVHRKGICVAVDVCKRLGTKLVIAGQPSAEGVDLSDPCVEFVGYADAAKRRELLSNARALFAPTIYIEPFGGVAIEAAFSGTPVLTTDWGAFSETVLHGTTGYRCRNLEQFLWAARNVEHIYPFHCRQWAERNYTLERVALQYDEYFRHIDALHKPAGWYELNPTRGDLDWLYRSYPLAI